MPPRSYYNSPRAGDYIAYAAAFFPDEFDAARDFVERYGRPYITSPTHLAGYIGISPSLIRQILHNPAYHYRTFPLKRRDGRDRLISTPKSYLKVIQWWILDNILNGSDVHQSAHGFVKNKSYLSNALIHVGSKHILNVDIKSFFDSIRQDQAEAVFADLGYCSGGRSLLTALTTRGGFTPTGAPTSPMLANLIFRVCDQKLSEFAYANGLNYTRYADDLTFSSSESISPTALSEISRIVGEAGFVLNEKKTKFMGRGDRQEVTGIVINAEPNMPKEWRNWVRGYLHSVSSNPETYAREMRRVIGIYGLLRQFDSSHQRPLTRKARDVLAKMQGKAS